MLVVTRFHVPVDAREEFAAQAKAATDLMATKLGYLDHELALNLDDPELWVMVSRWADVGSYRRSFNGYDSKVVIVPLLNRAIDEPSAFDDPESVGENVPRSR